MSPERTAVEDAQHVVDVANAVMRARAYDATSTSIGLAVIATTVAGDDQMARTTLAIAMLKMARELDPDLVNARWQ